MAKIKPRVKVPSEASKGEIVEIKALISHPMHTGLAKDKQGNVIPRKIINQFRVTFEGTEVFNMTMAPAVSANPFVAFPFKADASGAMEFVWVEDGGAEFKISKNITVS